MIAAHRRHPLLVPLLSYIAGIAAAGSYGIYFPSALLVFLLLPLVIFRKKPSPPALLLALSPALLVLGNLLMAQLLTADTPEKFYLDTLIGNRLYGEGIVVSRPETTASGSKLVLQLERLRPEDPAADALPISGRILLRIGSGRTTLLSGDRVAFRGRLRPPRNYGTPGEFDSERAAALKRIVATAFVASDADITRLGQADHPGFSRWIDAAAARIGTFITARVPGPDGTILKALIVGDSADIPQSLRDAYTRTGVSHILSISGFHVGIIALAMLQFWYALSRIFPAILLHCNFRRLAFALSLPLILYYMLLSGAAPATVRSVLMLLFVTLSLFLERQHDPLNLLLLAATALLVADPANLYAISFQLSFLAIWGLTLLTPLLAKPLTSASSGWRSKLCLFAAASAAAIIATFLPVAYYFQQASLTGIISNFLIVPLLGYGVVVLGFVAIPLIWLAPTIAGWLLAIAAGLTAAANTVIALLVQIPTPPPFTPTAAEIGIYLLTMVLLTVIGNQRAKYLLLAATTLCLLLLHRLPPTAGDYVLKMDFLSVGQGEATLVTFRDGKRMLIDGGGSLYDTSRDVGRQLLLPALRTLGVRGIDYLVLSHAHPDHLQGLIAVTAALPVGEFWETGLNAGSDYERLRQLLASRKVPVRLLDALSPPARIAGVTVRILQPEPPTRAPFPPAADQNENSLVMRFEAGRHAVLMTGDIGAASEFRLLDRQAPLRATVLKIPHHGSRYSVLPSFYAAISPQVAVISAGYKNSFHLPAAEALDALRRRGTRIYRTDLDGTVTAVFPKNGQPPTISTFYPAN